MIDRSPSFTATAPLPSSPSNCVLALYDADHLENHEQDGNEDDYEYLTIKNL